MIPSLVVFIRRNTCSILFGRRAKWKTQCVIALVIVLFVFFLLRGHHGIDLQTVTTKNLKDYCNFPVNANGMEGQLTTTNNYKLQTVQILIRHGDRTPIFNLKEISKIKLDCSMHPRQKTSKELFSSYLKSLKFIKSQKLSPKTLKHKLSSSSVVCKFNGQLTQRGFQQLMYIGQYLRKAYKTLKVTSTSNIYARSTNYDRTSQTTAALLHGFLGEDIETIGEIPVHVTKDTYFRDDPGTGLVRPCPGSKLSVLKSRMSAEFKEGMKAMDSFMQEMANMLIMPKESLPTVTFIADYPLTHFCHGREYPCTKKGCFNEQTTLKLLSYSDWYFHAKYNQFSDMLALPVLTQIGTRMLASAQSQSPITLAIYGGHESSIIPVLQSLRIFNRRWIPYASRLVFELWKKNNGNDNNDNNHENNNDNNNHNNSNNNDNNDSKEKELLLRSRFVRILFNGESLTYKLVFCKGKVVENGELCPLEEFLNWIGGGRFDDVLNRYDDLCNG